MDFKLSKYNFLFEHNEKSYLYNTLSTALIELDSQKSNCIRENRLDVFNIDEISLLQKMHFITELNNDENDEFMYYYDKIRYETSLKVLSITLIPTYNCNLMCPYCMQGNKKNSSVLDSVSMKSILSFIDNYLIDNKNTNKIAVSLFGGEPMLNKDILYEFCDKSKEIAIKNKCDTFYSMTSNMTLLDDKMIEYMGKYQIHTQVSIDGTPEQHDQRRVKKNGDGTYELIKSNLEKILLAGLKHLITIRINIDSSNIDKCDEIMSALKIYSDDIYFGFIDSFKGSNDNFTDCISSEKYPMYVTKKFTECYKKHGYISPKLFGKKTPCSINSEGKFFVDNKLDVYKCEMLVNHPDARVGYINSDGQFVPEKNFYNQMTFSPMNNKKCQDCFLLPMCAGGCPAKKYIENESKDGNLHLENCLFSKEQLLTYLKNYIDNGR